MDDRSLLAKVCETGIGPRFVCNKSSTNGLCCAVSSRAGCYYHLSMGCGGPTSILANRCGLLKKMKAEFANLDN